MQINFKNLLFVVPVLLLTACAKDAATEQTEATQTQEPPGLQGINALLAEQPDNPDLYYVRGEYFYEQGGFDEAVGKK